MNLFRDIDDSILQDELDSLTKSNAFDFDNDFDNVQTSSSLYINWYLILIIIIVVYLVYY